MTADIYCDTRFYDDRQWVAEILVTNSNSPIQDYTHPDDQSTNPLKLFTLLFITLPLNIYLINSFDENVFVILYVLQNFTLAAILVKL